MSTETQSPAGENGAEVRLLEASQALKVDTVSADGATKAST